MERVFLALTSLSLLITCALNPIGAAGAAEPNLVAHWTFDEGTGTIAYDSAGDNDGNLVNGPVWTSGEINSALDFNGSAGVYIEPSAGMGSPLNLYNKDMSISAWVKFRGAGGTIVARAKSNYVTYNLGISGNQAYINTYKSSSGHWTLYAEQVLDPDTWYHLAGVFDRDGDMGYVYIDGVEKAEGAMATDPLSNDAPTKIGCRNSTSDIAFNGVIDNVRIYNKALSAEEVWQLYCEGFGKKAFNPNPANGQTDVDLNVVLSWFPGPVAASHDVYLGTDYNDVNDANTSSQEYKGNQDVNHWDPCGLDPVTTYYWRIDEVNDVNAWKGRVWNFTTLAVWKNEISFPDESLASEVIFESDPRWVKFTIKLDDPCTVYFQNSKLYPFHYHFATEWLEPFIGMTVPEYFNVTLYDANQLASLGAVIFPPMTGSPPTPEFAEYGIQFIRYDPYTKEEIADMFMAVKNSVIADPCVTAFYFPAYEQLNIAEENRAWFESQGIPIGSIAQWIEGNIYYSLGWAMGELKYFPGEQIQDAYLSGNLLPEDILLTDGVPAEVPFVAGIITLSPSTPNSHVAILSNTYGIPFVYLAVDSDVNKVWQLENKLTLLCVQEIGGVCSVQLTDAEDVFAPDEIAQILALKTPAPLDISPIATYGGYSADTNNLLPDDINYFGGKASNYGILRTSIPDNAPTAVALSFDLWNDFLDQPLTPGESVIIEPNGYVLFWADGQPGQGPKHADFKLSKSGEDIGLFDIDGTTLIDGFSFTGQTTDVSYGRTPDGNDNWSFFYGGDISPNAPNPGGAGITGEGLFINEFMADNDSITADEYGEYDDWIEIYNSGPTAVDLGGMYLTDDLSNPTNWMIGVEISGSTLRGEIANRLAGYTYPVSDLAALSADLAAVRNIITNPRITNFSPQLQNAILAVLQDPNYGFDPNRNIRFRSSTNVEDSNSFTGAGLYDSYSGCLADDLDGDESGPCHCDPNETNERGVFRAIRKVLASFYNDNAYLERLRREVNEAEVGMAMLVHHSFPDEIELANGVATVEKRQSQTYWDIKLVTQKGATPVTNPEEGALPEEVSVYATADGNVSMTLIRQSNLVILGETVMEWQDDYNDLTQLLIAAAERFEQVTGKTEYILDLEYKKVASGGAALPAGGIEVDQIREIPPLDAINLTCPSPSTCSNPDPAHDFFVERTYEDSNGVSIETSYYLNCPSYPIVCKLSTLDVWCRTVIRGYTTKPIFLFSPYSQSYSAQHHNWCEDFLFTPHLEPGADQCALNQLRAKDIRVIHLGNMTACGTPYVETSGFGAGPYYLGDIEPDGDVDMADFARFAQRWLESDCGFCGGADFDCNEEVNFEDLEQLSDNWLAY